MTIAGGIGLQGPANSKGPRTSEVLGELCGDLFDLGSNVDCAELCLVYERIRRPRGRPLVVRRLLACVGFDGLGSVIADD